jgi:hypothetical protein
VEYISVIRERTALTWEDACEEWPSIGDETWFELLMGWCGSVTSATLTNTIKEEILARILADELEDVDDDENATQVNDMCTICNVVFVNLTCDVVLYMHMLKDT